MFRPPYLQPGDKVAIVSPAGAIAEEYITTGVEVLRSWELVPIIGPHANASYGYFAGTDAQRIQDMQWALDDPDTEPFSVQEEAMGVCVLSNNWTILYFKATPNGWSVVVISLFFILK